MSLINQVLQDLEKRHASESDLKSLPAYVRAVPGRPRSPVRMYVVAAIISAILIAVALLILGSRRAQENDAAQILSKPMAEPLAAPVPAPKLSVAAPVAAPPPQTAAFNPVSKISDELSLVTLLSPRKEKPAPTTPPAPVAERVTSPPAVPIVSAERSSGAIDKQMREVAPSERAEIAFRRGVTQLQEGRANAAELEFRDALKQDPSHTGALQAMLGLLLDSRRNNEAEQLVRKALEINPRQPRHAMVLARLEVERGEVTGAINTMVGALPYVQTDPDFHAFLAALLQREGRHREAVDYYRVALRGVPGNGVWIMGLGISLRAANQAAEARDAFQRAIDSKQLSPALQEFVERQLRELSAQKKK